MWSGIAMVIVPIAFSLVKDHVTQATILGVVVYLFAFIVMFQTVLIVMGMTVSALLRSYRMREYRWTWVIAFTLFVGAYLYGIFIATRKARSNRIR